MSTSAREVAHTSAKRLGHPARAGLDFFSQPPTLRKGPEVPERDLQKLDRVKIALRHGLSNTRGRM